MEIEVSFSPPKKCWRIWVTNGNAKMKINWLKRYYLQRKKLSAAVKNYNKSFSNQSPVWR
jgi:hypothetical protein